MYFYGDIHGDFGWMQKVFARQKQGHSALQLGDYGVGFPEHPDSLWIKDGLSWPPIMGNGFKFIRGNHDHPALCQEHPDYLGDYGYDEHTGIFYISGSDSIDKNHRTPQIDWWIKEQLSVPQLQNMIDLYESVKPRIVVSHTCPASIQTSMMQFALIRGRGRKGIHRTEIALDHCLELHRPERWLFAHYHRSRTEEIQGTRFSCIGINQRVILEGIEWEIV